MKSVYRKLNNFTQEYKLTSSAILSYVIVLAVHIILRFWKPDFLMRFIKPWYIDTFILVMLAAFVHVITWTRNTDINRPDISAGAGISQMIIGAMSVLVAWYAVGHSFDLFGTNAYDDIFVAFAFAFWFLTNAFVVAMYWVSIIVATALFGYEHKEDLPYVIH